MPEGSDSAGRPGPPGPFDQDACAQDAFDPNVDDPSVADTGVEVSTPEEPDFEGFLARSQQEREAAQRAAAEARQRAFTALAHADEDDGAEIDIIAPEARPPTVVVVATRGGASLERCVAALADQDL